MRACQIVARMHHSDNTVTTKYEYEMPVTTKYEYEMPSVIMIPKK
jgi:hypothetical protein